jgi:hypothetical protein
VADAVFYIWIAGRSGGQTLASTAQRNVSSR